ncbi:unnamed protein product [Moneuplotes crassus]|uniref:Uncharacterized protein n=1 Tax=Euplotes crassus TaxID=5936 RepID=A0AAD1XGJ7_EUPCR|nr:unnamed protein product [Moneuplotes crassus]
MNCQVSFAPKEGSKASFNHKKEISGSEGSSLKEEESNSKLEDSSERTEERKDYQKGKWTSYEHLIFLACVIHYGRDWKKIEEHVKTRSASQARSHAQKVLKKMDRNAIMREIRQIKSQINFDPKIHQCGDLVVLITEGDKWRNIPGVMPSRYLKKKRGSNQEASCPEKQVELKILKNSQKDLEQENSEIRRVNFNSITSDSKGNSKNEKNSPQKQPFRQTSIQTRGNSLSEAFKSSEIINTPDPKLLKAAGTPSTCVSSQASPMNPEPNTTLRKDGLKGSAAPISKAPSPKCFKNLSPSIKECGTNSMAENTCTSVRKAPSDEIYFDFDFQPFLRNDKVDIEFENLISLNSVQTGHDAFSSNESMLTTQWLLGDSMMPLSALY